VSLGGAAFIFFSKELTQVTAQHRVHYVLLVI
jgi:hypothetical protein